MSPRAYFYAYVRHGSTIVRGWLVFSVVVFGLSMASAVAQAQSNPPSGGWQAARSSTATLRANPPRTSELAPAKEEGWRPRSTPLVTVPAAPAQKFVDEQVQPVSAEVISPESVFDDAPRAKTAKQVRSLVWQQQSGTAGARRYPAATRPAATEPRQSRAQRDVVRTAYEFDDAPIDDQRATAGANSSIEAIPAPEPVATQPIPANSNHSHSLPSNSVAPDSGMIYDDSSEMIPGEEVEGDLDMGDEACGCCEDCGNCSCIRCCRPFAGRLWVRSEYLLWWSPGYGVPALVTTSTSNNFATAGRLGDPETTTLFGGDRFAGDTRSGLRIGAGYLLMPCRDVSIEGYYTTTGELTNTFSAASSTFPVLARPYFNVLSDSQEQAAHIIAFPQEASGSVTVTATSEFNSAEALLRRKMRDEHNFHLDFLAGYRYARLAEGLQITEAQTILGPRMPFPETTVLSISDSFETLNEFNGGQFGFTFSEQYRRWTLDVVAKLAVGNTRTQVAINGATSRTGVGGVPNATLTYAGGVLAQPTNMGLYETNSITVMPELGLKLGFHLNRRLKLSAGYNFVYWSKIARPGDQIDTDINSSQVPPGTLGGAGFPKYPNRTTDFWLQGVTAGLEYRF